MSLDDTCAELAYVSEQLHARQLSSVTVKLRNIVTDHYPLNNTREALKERETLDALLVCDVVLPPVDPVYMQFVLVIRQFMR